jgi:hypothetical protein
MTDESQGGVERRSSNPDQPTLVPGRSCGTCSLCCKVYSIRELNKSAGRWCVHAVRGSGCSIHDNRPQQCRQFFCSWLFDPNLGSKWKPEVSRFVLSTDPVHRALMVMVDPGMPLAWKREPYYSVLKQFSEVFFRINNRVLVSVRGHITVILPDREVPIGKIMPRDEIAIWREGRVYCAELRRDADLLRRLGEVDAPADSKAGAFGQAVEGLREGTAPAIAGFLGDQSDGRTS